MKRILMGINPGVVLRKMRTQGTLAQLEPTLAELDMVVPQGYHHKDNLEHSIRVLENAIQRETDGPDLVLRTAALFHDIGKPESRAFGNKGLVTFEGHEIFGARMVKWILPKHGYSRDEVKQISTLVAFHMRSHGFEEQNWTDSGVRRLIADTGSDELMSKLIIIFYSDATTKFPSKLARLHANVDNLVAEIKRVRDEDARKALRPALTGNDVMTLFKIPAGRELGVIMKFLNSDEGIKLTKEEIIQLIPEKFSTELNS